jgi:hypothetical protein
MKIQVKFEYTESVVPQGCRKPRPQGFEASMALTIHELSLADAPVAIREIDYYPRPGESPLTEYRWWRKKLWIPYRSRPHVDAPYEEQTATQFEEIEHKHRCYGSKTQKEVRQEIKRWASNILFIDGLRYELAGEPRYVVMTFGLGHNHGIGWGTSLSTVNFYNSNISKKAYYRIDQFEAAVAATERTALGRGDTKAVPVVEVQNPNRFEILIPEAVRLQPHREHGNGDPFLNKIEGIIQNSGNPVLSGVLVINEAFSGLRK